MEGLGLLQSLQESFAQKAGVKSVFGDPITVGDKMVLPVARIGYGFGAGAGTGGVGENNKGEGGGGGGGVMAKPVGVFVIGPTESRFVSTHEARRTLGVLALGVLLGLILRRKRRERGRLWSRGIPLRG
jgi:uncharacterized spore protein YtfJ